MLALGGLIGVALLGLCGPRGLVLAALILGFVFAAAVAGHVARVGSL